MLAIVMVLADWPVLIPGYLNPTLPTAVLFAPPDASGKDIINIYGGVTWGWQLQRAP
ncbi:MAG TPA: hypothetical protein VHW04_09035 [Solirubrobacteraceae bacterium]|nr:hypothetical protein [Solirubrobacteraceae bacterium]